jgi:hypothetical protein
MSRRWICSLTIITKRPEAPSIGVVVEAASPVSASTRAMREGMAKWKKKGITRRVTGYLLKLTPGEKRKQPTHWTKEDQQDLDQQIKMAKVVRQHMAKVVRQLPNGEPVL